MDFELSSDDGSDDDEATVEEPDLPAENAEDNNEDEGGDVHGEESDEGVGLFRARYSFPIDNGKLICRDGKISFCYCEMFCGSERVYSDVRRWRLKPSGEINQHLFYW